MEKRQNDNYTSVETRSMKRRRLALKSSEAGPSHSEQKPHIFKLDADCIDELFDYLTLKELCAIGRTCKRLQHVAGIYFRQNYPMTEIEFGWWNKNGQTVSKGKIYTNFAPYAQRIVIYGDDLDDFCRAALMNYRNLKEIQFDSTFHPTIDQIKCVFLLTNHKPATAVHFIDCSWYFRDIVLDGVHKLLVKLKRLGMKGSLSLNDPNEFDEWKSHHIPTLERFEMLDKMESSDLKVFLQANRQIKQLVVKPKISYLEAIQESGIELDELDLSVVGQFGEEIHNRLVSLHANGQIKHLSVHFDAHMYYDDDFVEELGKINFLTSLNIEGYNYYLPDLSAFVNLKKLYIGGSYLDPEEVEPFVQALINLEELYVRDDSLLIAMPFACSLPKLRIIEADKRSDEDINLKALNEKRKNLTNARILKIFLHDKAFHQMRWSSIDLFYDMVEVRRAILRKEN